MEFAGTGKNYDWSKGHVFIKSTIDLSDGRLTLVEDVLKPGFLLTRHPHKKMIEIFNISGLDRDGAAETGMHWGLGRDDRPGRTEGLQCKPCAQGVVVAGGGTLLGF